MTASLQELPPARTMRKYIGILNDISAIGAQGFGYVLDTATPEELAELERAAELIQRHIDRVKA